MSTNPERYRVTKDTPIGPDVDLETEEVYDPSGNRVDREYVNRAVTNVHEKLGRGRPSLGKGPSPRIESRVSEDLRAKIEARARKENKRVSEVVRDALERYVS